MEARRIPDPKVAGSSPVSVTFQICYGSAAPFRNFGWDTRRSCSLNQKANGWATWQTTASMDSLPQCTFLLTVVEGKVISKIGPYSLMLHSTFESGQQARGAGHAAPSPHDPIDPFRISSCVRFAEAAFSSWQLWVSRGRPFSPSPNTDRQRCS